MGTDLNDVRPTTNVRMGEILESQHGDQSYLYPYTTGFDVPGGVGGVVSGHVHDGTNGVVMPVPLAQWYLGAKLPPMTDSDISASASPAYGLLTYAPFYVPPGVDEVAVVMYGASGHASEFTFGESFHFQIYDDSGAAVFASSADTSLHKFILGTVSNVGDSPTWRVAGAITRPAVPVVADAINILVMYAYDGRDLPNTGNAVGYRSVDALLIFPGILRTEYPPVPAFQPGAYTDTAVRVPGQNEWITGATTKEPYAAFDATEFDDNRAISSMMVNKMAGNNALLGELAYGLPAGGNAVGHSNDQSYKGHNHGNAAASGAGGEVTVSDLDSSGARVGMPLGAWAFGVGRGPFTNRAGHPRMDEKGATFVNGRWTGQIYAPCLRSTATGNTYYTVTEALVFRMPDSPATDYSGGSTELVLTFVCYNDSGQTMTIRATPSIVGGATGSGQTCTMVTGGTGSHPGPRGVAEIQNFALPSGAAGELCSIEIEMKVASGSGDIDDGPMIYGCCLHLKG